MQNGRSEAMLGYGTKLLLGDGGSPQAFAEIGEIVDGPDDEDSADLVEVTNHQSPNRRKEYIGDLIDGGEITLTCNYIRTHATHDRATGLLGLIGQKRDFVLIEPGAVTGELWPCVIMSVGRTHPVQGGAMQMSVTLKKAGDMSAYPPIVP